MTGDGGRAGRSSSTSLVTVLIDACAHGTESDRSRRYRVSTAMKAGEARRWPKPAQFRGIVATRFARSPSGDRERIPSAIRLRSWASSTATNTRTPLDPCRWIFSEFATVDGRQRSDEDRRVKDSCEGQCALICVISRSQHDYRGPTSPSFHGARSGRQIRITAGCVNSTTMCCSVRQRRMKTTSKRPARITAK